jgi:hypothetical protein
MAKHRRGDRDEVERRDRGERERNDPPRRVWGGYGERRPLGAGAAGGRGALEHADPFTHDRRGLVESGYLDADDERPVPRYGPGYEQGSPDSDRWERRGVASPASWRGAGAQRTRAEEEEPRWGRGGVGEPSSPEWGFRGWGTRSEPGWRGPGEAPGYRPTHRRDVVQQPPNAGGQVPGELRQWDREDPRSRPRGGGPHGGRGPRGYRRSDPRIHEDVCDRLTVHPNIDAREVEVEVSEGKVVLRGEVPDRRSKYLAEDLAEAVLGVLEVDNRLRVQRVPRESNPRGEGGGERH